MQDNISPEERLLRLIRGDQKKAKEKKQKLAVSADVSTSRHKIKKAVFAISFAVVNRIFIGVLLVLGIYLLMDFLIINPHKIEETVLTLGELKEASLEELSAALFKPVAYYTRGVKARNIFTAVSPRLKRGLPSSSFTEKLSKLKLQGIVSGVTPQAIIEDTKTGQVYFLSPGEYIGEIELKEILPGKVKLNFYGQEAELSM